MITPAPLFVVVPDDVPDDALSLDQLGSRIVGMAGRLASAMCRWLLLVAAFDAHDGARRFALPSTARWLGHYCGLSRRTAIEHVRVARALAANPPLAEAMAAGRISFSHARAIARVAELGEPELVERLVMVAEHGTVGQLEDVVRGLRTVERNEASEPDAGENISHRWRDDSYLGVAAKLDPEHGALLLAAVDRVARAEGLTQPQALTRIAEIALATLNADTPAAALRGHEYAAVVVHLDASRVPAEPGDNPQSQLEGCSAEHTYAEPYARIARGPGLPDSTVKRLLCSGRIRAVVSTDERTQGGETEGRYRWRAGVLDIGANRRLVTDKQFRALLRRDGACCSVPGCGSTIGLEAHHVRPWIYGGKTVMANLILLCRAHHHAIHDDAFRIVAEGNQRFRFYRPDGRELPAVVAPGDIAASPDLDRPGGEVAPWAATTRWDGTRLDLDYAVAALAPRLHSVKRLAA